jgi:hypothetical protein
MERIISQLPTSLSSDKPRLFVNWGPVAEDDVAGYQARKERVRLSLFAPIDLPLQQEKGLVE